MTPSRDIKRLLEIMSALRAPETGCPWDLEQDFNTIAPYTIEEAYEVADAIERKDMDDLRLELGDLLLQSVYHAQIAEEKGHFDFGDVVEGITRKMIRRHPHVFGTADASAEEYSAQGLAKGTWEKIKAEEKAERELLRKQKGLTSKENKDMSILDDIPNKLPALTTAIKLQKKAAKIGFDWDDPNAVIKKIREELDELEVEIQSGTEDTISEELGDLIFTVANLARHMDIEPESSLRGTNMKFRRRFSYIEKELSKTGKPFSETSLEDMETLWQKAKHEC